MITKHLSTFLSLLKDFRPLIYRHSRYLQQSCLTYNMYVYGEHCLSCYEISALLNLIKKNNLKSLELGIKLEEETKKAKKHRRSFL